MPEVVNPLKEDGTPKTPEEIEQEQIALENNPPAPGSKTDPALLLKSLQEEREKRVDLESQIDDLKQQLSDASNSPDIFSDEGKALSGKIKTLEGELSSVKGDLARKDILIEYPIIKEKSEDFEKFITDPENKGMSLKTAAKAFLIENGLLDIPRKGLERPTGGPRTPTSQKLSTEDIKHLRETNFKKYQEMLEKGLIEV